MKTITEFSGILLQRAAEAQRGYRAEHPQLAAPEAEVAPPAPAAAEGTGTDEGAPQAAAAESEAVVSESASDGAAASLEAASSDGGESEAVSDAQPKTAAAP